MVQPIQYVTPGAFDPFNSLMQGVRLGATFEEMQAARQQREMQQQQMLMHQDMVRSQQQALQQKAMQEQARQEELARLQAIPYDQMTKEQSLRMMDLTQSEATRAHIARRLEAIPAEKRQTLARDYGSTLIALTMNPEVGIRRLRERAQVETDPGEKKALEDAVRIAELDPMLAARTIHGSMHMSQDPDMVKIAESATKYLETAGKPLYPKAVPPKTPATIVSTDADKVRLGLVENGRPLPGVWAIEPGKAPQQLRPEVARAVGGAGGGAAKPQEAEVKKSDLMEAFDPSTGQIVFATAQEVRERGLTPKSGMTVLDPKEIRRREAVFPKENAAVKTISNTMKTIRDTVDLLLANKDGLNGITGGVFGRTPSITPSSLKAQADLNTLRNLAFVQGITELRSSSPTGGAVGNVSNREGDRFDNLKTSLEQTQSYDDLVASLKRMKAQAQSTEDIVKDAFDRTYEYREQLRPAAPPPAPGRGGAPAPSQPAPQTAAPVTVTLPDGRTVTFPSQAAADQFRRAAGL
jgi:hypothetical protein